MKEQSKFPFDMFFNSAEKFINENPTHPYIKELKKEIEFYKFQTPGFIWADSNRSKEAEDRELNRAMDATRAFHEEIEASTNRFFEILNKHPHPNCSVFPDSWNPANKTTNQIMDQHIVEFKIAMLLPDMIELLALISKSGDRNLIQYVKNWKDQVNKEEGLIIFEDKQTP